MVGNFEKWSAEKNSAKVFNDLKKDISNLA